MVAIGRQGTCREASGAGRPDRGRRPRERGRVLDPSRRQRRGDHRLRRALLRQQHRPATPTTSGRIWTTALRAPRPASRSPTSPTAPPTRSKSAPPTARARANGPDPASPPPRLKYPTVWPLRPQGTPGSAYGSRGPNQGTTGPLSPPTRCSTGSRAAARGPPTGHSTLRPPPHQPRSAAPQATHRAKLSKGRRAASPPSMRKSRPVPPCITSAQPKYRSEPSTVWAAAAGPHSLLTRPPHRLLPPGTGS